ncbi:MAG: indole-3-glycerol phosphate synthase TrpC [Acidobacteriales bacterium]|nr:indole-3-glycerol phosphate synthase TrpC [Terriglobales bacterium]
MVTHTRRRVQQSRQARPMAELERQAALHQPRGFRAALESASREKIAIIAELKKASPSKGLIRGSFPVARLANELEAAGAAALSVLTEEEFFQGSLANLQEASAATRIPCLRKDFIVDEFQVLEARAHRADAILLIVAALDDATLRALHKAAVSHGIDVLCEVHDEEELERALAAGCETIGANSRYLKTLHVDRNVLFRLAERIPAHVLRVAESGLSSAAELRQLRDAGYQSFLIGESLMRAEAPGIALREMIAGGVVSPAGKV